MQLQFIVNKKIEEKKYFPTLTCSMAVLKGADDCGRSESMVSTSTSISSGAPFSFDSSSPEEPRRSEEPKVFLQHITSSEAASENSPGRSRI